MTRSPSGPYHTTANGRVFVWACQKCDVWRESSLLLHGKGLTPQYI